MSRDGMCCKKQKKNFISTFFTDASIDGDSDINDAKYFFFH